MQESAVIDAVDDAFERTRRGLPGWADPNPDRSPPEEAYSRLTDPAKWRILGARAEAWLEAARAIGVATIERDVRIDWRTAPGPVITRTDRAVPQASGALPLVIGRSRLGDVDDAGVVLGVGNPTICVQWFPDCGCDACDSGSQDELDHLDAHVLGIVTGAFRRLSSGAKEITVIGAAGWSAHGFTRRGEAELVVADPTGWDEVAGASWLGTDRR